jgi:MFS family permease
VTTFLVFLLAYTISQFYRSFLAVIAPELSAELALTPADLGTISGVWFAAFALAQFPVGYALDRYGPRRSVPVIMLAAVAGAVIFAYARNAADCLAGIALIGIGCSPVYMGALYVFGRTFERNRFAFLSSTLLAIGSLGNVLGTTPLAVAAATIGWRGAILAVAGVALVAAALVALLVQDPPRVEGASGRRGALAEFRELLSIRALWPLLPLTAVSYAVVIAERALWVGPYFSEVYGLGPIDRGNAVLVMATAMIAGALAYGPLDQIIASRKRIVLIGSIVTGVGFLLLWGVPKPPLWAAIALMALIGGVGSTYAVLMAHGRSFLPDHLLGRGITLLNFGFIGGAGIVQLVSGRYVAALRASGTPPDAVYANLHLGFGLALLAATLIYLASRERR